VVGAEAHLAGRAQHAVGPLAPHLAAADLQAAGHGRADGGQGDQVAGRHVERPAGDLQRLAVASVDIDQVDLVGVGVRARGEDPGHDDPAEPLADAVELLDGRAEVAELLADGLGVALDGGEVPQPRQKDLHVVCTSRASELRTG
jgi:hypothetical protein